MVGGGTRRSRVVQVYAPFIAVAVLWAVARFAGYRGLNAMAWLPGVAAMTLTAWYLYQASGAAGLAPAGRRFWRRTALAALLIAPATGPMPQAPVLGPRIGLVLAIAVALLLVALLLILWALLRLPARHRSRGDWIRLLLDGATVMVAAATFLWYYVLRPVVRPGVDPRTLLGFLILSVVCLLAVLAVVKVMLAGTDAVAGAALRTLAVAVLVGAAISAATPVYDSAGMAGVSGVTTTVEAMLAALAGAVQLEEADRGPHRTAKRRRTYSVLPYIAVAAIDGLLVAVTAKLGTGTGVVVVGAVVATAIVVVRQLMAFRDNDSLVGSLREYQALLREQATHDPLTGLANRALFNETLAEVYATDRPLAGCIIDLDNFKSVNDTRGHAVGDGLLVEVGQRLRRAVRDGDLVARLGGDEFAVLLPDSAADDADAVAARILAELAAPVTTHGHELIAGASIGVAERRSGDDPETLLHHADLALYAAKGRGKGNWARYGTGVPAPATPARVTFAPAVNLAPVVNLAPPMNLAGDDLTGDNLAGDVVELATTLDAGHTLADVCASAGHPDTPLSVLVDSERLRQPGFAAEVGAALARSQRPADQLTIVVTAAGDLGGIDAALRDVRATGVRLGLHVAADTPTTLTAIMALELSRLTVDVSFLTQPDGDGATARRRTALAAGIARIAHEAGLECVAVGASDAVLVRTLGYSLAQGSPDEAGTLVALDRSANRQECHSGTTNAVVSA